MTKIRACLILLLFCYHSCSWSSLDYERISIKGSDTEVNLALSLAETYMERDSAISIAVTGGGSGMGIASLINGKTDIANSSRPMKKQEIELAYERGIQPLATVFAVDALAIIVNPQLAAIYKGELSNWSSLGGAGLNIDKPKHYLKIQEKN